MPQPTTAGKLGGASRRIPKCTYVPFDVKTLPEEGGAVAKSGFVGKLGLQPGEVDAAARWLAASGSRAAPDDSALSTLRRFEGEPIPSQLPPPKALAGIPSSSLRAFGQAVVQGRLESLNRLRQPGDSPGTRSLEYATALSHYNNATVGLNIFEMNSTVAPIGWLNLERLEMTPVGIETGELIATIPLAPMEQTAVVHKEWSVTTKEFTSIVTDSLENYSETGVTDNTDLAQSATSQTTHSNQFNINATVSGGYGPVTATVASGFSAQDQNSKSATESVKHAIATTRKASARVRQEHKVTISTTTVTGTSETSTRVLQNPSQTDPMRIDYFSMMRKWHVGLYRYGLRLTYDIGIPEPGATMRKLYAQLDNLKKKIRPFNFPITSVAQITRETYKQFGDQYQIALPLPPNETDTMSVTDNFEAVHDTEVHEIRLDIPPGHIVQLTDNSALLYASLVRPATGEMNFEVAQVPQTTVNQYLLTTFQNAHPTQPLAPGDKGLYYLVPLIFLGGSYGKQYVEYLIGNVPRGSVKVDLILKLTDAGFSEWQQQVWSTLYNAAQNQYYAQQQDYQAQIAALEEQISNVDTLTLRREENEEIMKGVLRWLLGPNFDFMPADIVQLFKTQAESHKFDIDHGAASGGGDGLAITADSWAPVLIFGEMVKFINEAIEWENVLYFLYSYFWDVPPSWDFIRQIKHPDAIRQAFLRAGSARVVLTVRKGWEEAWVNFVEVGGFGETLLPSHPYMTIAQEIHDYDETNYPGIPPANPGGGPLPDDGTAAATECTDKFSTLLPIGPVTFNVKSSAGFQVGYTAIIDSYDKQVDIDGHYQSVQESRTITAIAPDGKHITVDGIGKPHDGSDIPFPIMQAGEKGQLIAEWFEYTPTSGTDIFVTSNLATIA